MGIYIAMVAWSLPKIAADANGLLPFDVRLGGYSFSEARAFLAALSADGNAFYRNVQQILDKVFPALEALSVGWAIYLLTPQTWGFIRFALACYAIPGMIFDYLENAQVTIMLQTGAADLTKDLTGLASYYTQMKSIFVTLSFVVLLVMIVFWFFRHWRAKNAVV